MAVSSRSGSEFGAARGVSSGGRKARGQNLRPTTPGARCGRAAAGAALRHAASNTACAMSSGLDSPPAVMRAEVAEPPWPPSAAPPMPVAMNDGQTSVHVHAVVLDLGAQGVEEAVQRMLAGRVAGAPEQRREAGHAGNRRHHAAASRCRCGQGGVRQCTAPKKLTSITRRITSGRCRAKALRCEMPALLTSTSMRAEVAPRSGDGGVARGRVGRRRRRWAAAWPRARQRRQPAPAGRPRRDPSRRLRARGARSGGTARARARRRRR